MSGSVRLESRELTQAYPKSSFWVVASPRELPRGAKSAGGGTPANPHPVSVGVRISANQELIELRTPNDFKSGLIPIHSEDDARIAAAAILSTRDGYYFAPSIIESSQIEVQHDAKGWICRFKSPPREGRVVFSADGKCTDISMQYRGPFPGLVSSLRPVED